MGACASGLRPDSLFSSRIGTDFRSPAQDGPLRVAFGGGRPGRESVEPTGRRGDTGCPGVGHAVAFEDSGRRGAGNGPELVADSGAGGEGASGSGEGAELAGWIALDEGLQPVAWNAFATLPTPRQDRLEKALLPLPEPERSPAVAAWLGILPGGGYFYSGRKSSGVFAFLFTGAVAALSVESFNEDQEVLGAAFALITAGFWSGSWSGAIRAVEEDNRLRFERHVQQAKESVREEVDLPATGARIVFSIPF